jgi:hypothetical protein
MKKTTICRSLLLLMLTAVSAHAAPFLVADAVAQSGDPNLNPVSYVITGLAISAVTTQAVQNADGTLQLKYDLGSLANGSYTVAAAAVNVFGGESAFSTPLTFTKGAPGTPMNLRISPN